MKNILDKFASKVFCDNTMAERLDKDTYKALKKARSLAIEKHEDLEIGVANMVATALKEWAIENGATHYCHWFQPMTGITAEKHDSFLSFDKTGNAILEFSGKELVRGEPDASSFPSGGLRATFEARGYTVWDTTSYAFIKDGSLCIPTAFCSYSGEALDKKTPLLRSMQSVNKQAMRILRLFGNNSKATQVVATVGAEQEYFLIDKKILDFRPDLKYTGRTLFGAPPSKGQEMDDHYFGVLKSRVSEFMKELDEELWKLGVYSKTKHNETAPAQHEIAPIFSTTSVATDHNQLIMEMIKVVADRHGLVALLHEKPFEGINGSGKHNNWSLATDTGVNLLDPTKTPHKNMQFLLFLVAVIKAVDEYQDLLRVSSSSASNDLRLGGHEAPPAIISMFLGDELTEILNCLADGNEYEAKGRCGLDSGAMVLANFNKDTTDRNRTSPFAFTGNKFEFRMVGSSFSIAGPNIVLNSAVAKILSEFADKLENSKNFNSDLKDLIRVIYSKHKRIIFNGNNYTKEWELEAKKRGLSNHKTTVDALPAFVSKKSVDLFENQKVFNELEVNSRYEILLEAYSKTIKIEALTMLEIAKKDITSSVIEYQKLLSETIKNKIEIKIFDRSLEEYFLTNISNLSKEFLTKMLALEKIVNTANKENEPLKKATHCKDKVIPAMKTLRTVVDKLEQIVSSDYWPLPSYSKILSSV